MIDWLIDDLRRRRLQPPTGRKITCLSVANVLSGNVASNTAKARWENMHYRLRISGYCVPKITKIGSSFFKLYKKIQRSFFRHMVSASDIRCWSRTTILWPISKSSYIKFLVLTRWRRWDNTHPHKTNSRYGLAITWHWCWRKTCLYFGWVRAVHVLSYMTCQM